MPTQSNITADHELFSGKDRTLSFTITDSAGSAQAITGWAMQFTLTNINDRSGTALITKTVGSGITITNGAGGICQVAIADTDTDGLVGSDAPRYWYELARTDAGNEDVLAYGTVVLRQGRST